MSEFASKLNVIQEKWQEKWNEERIYESDPNKDDKFFITVAYPYPSGGMHIGHVRTFTLPDVFSRFKRMQGYNVLFPMAWHVTGTPIIGALDRLKEGEEEQWEVLTDTYNVPEDVLEQMEEPMDFADYFIENSYKPNMKKLGFGVDWRREFTTNDDKYSKFIEWQYKRLHDQNLVEKGMHPTKYCLNDENPVTTHDLLEGETAEKQDYTLVKFEGEDFKLPMATLRPETVYGVTHTLVDPEATYKIVEVDGEENWVLSSEAVEKLQHQDRKLVEVSEIEGEELVGRRITNPVTKEKVLILPATFVDTDSGSGLVMSVPAHAPYDYISLEDLKNSPDTLREYGLDVEEVRDIEPIQIINVEGYDSYPAVEACEEYGVESQDDEEALEKATEEVYEKEFHSGTLNSSCGEFTGNKVNDVKDKIIRTFEDSGEFDSMYDFSEEVVCRCGGKVVVSLQESWFLSYGDRGWKDKVHKNLDEMNIIPGDKCQDYEHTIDWLESWPAIRNYGLGTKMPFDDDFIVEPLSDSTIYMSFYTIKHIIDDIEAEKLEPEFFDYVYNGEGDPEELAEALDIDQEIIEEAHESFEYWYPLDWRTSGHDLVQNHLTFMMFHHTALFDEENWPQGIATWGMGTLEGEKMSSSKGHVVLPDEAIQEYGADTVRFFLFASVEPWQDFDWRAKEVEKYQNKLRSFYNRTIEMDEESEEREKTTLDKYALSRLQHIIEETTEGLEDFQTRKAGLNAFFELNSLINKYRKRSETLNKEVVDQLTSAQVRLMAPFTPHICEELWSKLGNDGFVSKAEWPEVDESLIDDEVESRQEFVEAMVEDIRELEDMVDSFETVKLVLADEWKREVFDELHSVVEERPEFGEAMGRMVDGRKDHADQIKSYLQDYLNNPGDLPQSFDEETEKQIIEENKEYLEKEFDTDIEIVKEADTEDEKADRAEPGKPAIILE